MKKITRKDLQGLRQQFPVLTKEDMRHYVGGEGNSYFGGDWIYHGFGGYDPDGNFHWYSGYTQEELDNWEGSWPGGWVYGLGYVAPDTDIYGKYPGGNDWNSYDPWGYDPYGPGSNGSPGFSGFPGFSGNFGYDGYYPYPGSDNPGENSTGSGPTGNNTTIPDSFINDLTAMLKQSFTNLIAGSAEIAHDIYLEVNDFLHQYPGSIDTIREYMRKVEEYVPVEEDPNKMGWGDLFNIWLFELETSNMQRDKEGNIIFIFEEDAQTTKDLQLQEGVLQARNKALAQLKNGDFSSINHPWSYDVDQFIDGVVNMNTATSFLGSYNTLVEIIDNLDGTYTLKYTVKNTTGWESGTRLRVDHKEDEDTLHDAIIPNCDRGESVGLGGTIEERWSWSETITIN